MTYFLCRLVVWGLRSIQPEWHLLPRLVQRGPLQWHQVVLLEGSKSDGYHDYHDGAPGKLLTAWCHMEWTSLLMNLMNNIQKTEYFPGGFSFWTSWTGADAVAWGHVQTPRRRLWFPWWNFTWNIYSPKCPGYILISIVQRERTEIEGLSFATDKNTPYQIKLCTYIWPKIKLNHKGINP